LILDTLPSEYDSRVKAMEVDEKPTEDYNDIGGLEKQVICFPELGVNCYISTTVVDLLHCKQAVI
jgi:ATP-dependent 26S proteasome regulatory subunit